MKTKRIIFSMAILALTVLSFGQRASLMERIFSNQFQQVAVFTVDRSVDESRLESWMSDLRSWAGGLRAGTAEAEYGEAVVLRSISVPVVEVVYEDAPLMEAWMEAPFAEAAIELPLELEEWMTGPFGEGLALESWMKAPFVTVCRN